MSASNSSPASALSTEYVGSCPMDLSTSKPMICGISNIPKTNAAEQPLLGAPALKRSDMPSNFPTPTPLNSKSEPMAKTPAFYCQMCSITFNSHSSLREHEGGKRHRRMLEVTKLKALSSSQSSNVEEAKVSSTRTNIRDPIAPSVLRVIDSNRMIVVESKQLCNEENVYSQKVSTKSPLYCSFCNVHLPSVNLLKLHVSGRKHKAAIATLKREPTSTVCFSDTTESEGSTERDEPVCMDTISTQPTSCSQSVDQSNSSSLQTVLKNLCLTQLINLLPSTETNTNSISIPGCSNIDETGLISVLEERLNSFNSASGSTDSGDLNSTQSGGMFSSVELSRSLLLLLWSQQLTFLNNQKCS